MRIDYSWIQMYNIYILPAQDLVLHSSSSVLSPKQWSPKRSGRGLVHERVRLLIPSPHVTEHIPQIPHKAQPPCTITLQ
jgi:hypothetical protein